MDGPITIVKRDTIPPAQAEGAARGEGIGELRDFRWNDQLRAFMPDVSALSVSWMRLEPGEILQPRALSTDSLMVVYEGSADITGDVPRTVAAEDVVIVPSGCEHGFVSGPRGLSALSIQLGEVAPPVAREQPADAEHTLEGLLEYNAARLAEFQGRAIFELWSDGTLDDPIRHAKYHGALSSWIARSSALLLVRLATCADPKYTRPFRARMLEELERGVLAEPSSSAARDPVLCALTDWFTRQMYVLDNVEKVAIFDLVVTEANAALGSGDDEGRLWAHGYAVRTAETSRLLGGETRETYARLRAIVAEAWDMVGAMTDRVVELTNLVPLR
jgi:mannose-6-phosphate isomerase-like protein (cupin superfamily)